MKQFTILLMLILIGTFAFSQSKFKAGIYVEGGKGFPETSDIKKKGFSTGGGIYGSYPFLKKCSVSLGAGYRYKTHKAVRIIDYNEDDENLEYGYGYETTDVEFQEHYFVMPLKLQFTPKRNFFIETGIETTWLLNYDYVNEKPEFNWVLGCGYHLGNKTNLAVRYVRGFKDQGFGNLDDTREVSTKGELYRKRILMMSVSYSIFEK